MILAYRQAEIHDFPLLTAVVEDVNDLHQESVVVRTRSWERLYCLIIDAHGVRLELANERRVGIRKIGTCLECGRQFEEGSRIGIGTGCPGCGRLSDLPDFADATDGCCQDRL